MTPKVRDAKGPNMDRPLGVILAGGLARRMGGGDKSLLSLGASCRVLDLVIARLGAQVDQMVLNANGDPARFGEFGLPVVADSLDGFLGPLAGVLAGLDYANGRCAAAVLIDSDLQHPPDRIPTMVQAWRDGAEVVTAVRDDRDEESRMKVATASWFYRVFNRLVDSIQLQEGAGDFRLLSAPVVEAVTQMREATRFSKGLMPWTGYRSLEIPYTRVARPGGRTSWNSYKLWRYALDGIFSFTVKPLKVWGVIGALISMLSFL